jgi:hypothetical protein
MRDLLKSAEEESVSVGTQRSAVKPTDRQTDEATDQSTQFHPKPRTTDTPYADNTVFRLSALWLERVAVGWLLSKTLRYT